MCVCQHPRPHTLHTFSAYISTVACRHSASSCIIMQRAHFAHFAHCSPNALGVAVSVRTASTRVPSFLAIPFQCSKKYEKYGKYAGASRGALWRLLGLHTFWEWSKQSMKSMHRMWRQRADAPRPSLAPRVLSLAVRPCKCVSTRACIHCILSLHTFPRRRAVIQPLSALQCSERTLHTLHTFVPATVFEVVVGVYCIRFVCALLFFYPFQC